jgi:hypothetical protein
MDSTLARGCIGVALLLSACQSAVPVGEPAKGVPAANVGVQPLDPESLIGVWSGRMTAMDDPSLNMKMVLTVRRVTDGYVFGLREVYPNRRPVVSRPFRGTLEGNELRIGPWSLTVFPGRMIGHSHGGTGPMADHGGVDVDLRKE